MKTLTKAFLGLALVTCSLAASAQTKDPLVGGAAMYPTKTILENAVKSPIHKTLVSAVKDAGLADSLNGPGPFTVFAPTDDAFAKLPQRTVDNLMQPENKSTLTKILTYHVVPGRITSSDLKTWIKKGNGKYELKTVEGGMLTASLSGRNIVLTDEKGGTATIAIPDVFQSNGVIHVINAVLMPK